MQHHSIHILYHLAIVLFVVLLSGGQTTAQTDPPKLEGIVLELQSGETMYDVLVTNIKTEMSIRTDREGRFAIAASLNDRLKFEYSGYRTDTIVVIEYGLKRVYLTPADGTIVIDAVSITAMTDHRLHAEIEKAQQEGAVAESSQYRGGLRLSPSRLFGHEGKQARQRYHLLIAERERREVERRFSPDAIQALTPLTGRDLDLFRAKFRPEPGFAATASEQEMQLYIMDSYAAFTQLSEAERAAIKLEEN